MATLTFSVFASGTISTVRSIPSFSLMAAIIRSSGLIAFAAASPVVSQRSFTRSSDLDEASVFADSVFPDSVWPDSAFVSLLLAAAPPPQAVKEAAIIPANTKLITCLFFITYPLFLYIVIAAF